MMRGEGEEEEGKGRREWAGRVRGREIRLGVVPESG
jgi:hypothetical protein